MKNSPIDDSLKSMRRRLIPFTPSQGHFLSSYRSTQIKIVIGFYLIRIDTHKSFYSKDTYQFVLYSSERISLLSFTFLYINVLVNQMSYKKEVLVWFLIL